MCGIQNVQRDSELSINDPLSVSYGDIKCLLWNARRVQPLAELNQAERSEAPPREARPAAEGGRPPPLAERSEALPPSLARASNKSTDATPLPATEHVAYILP